MGTPTGKENLPEIPEGNSYLKGSLTKSKRELTPEGNSCWELLPVPEVNSYLKGNLT
jgi:hypothetical protein